MINFQLVTTSQFGSFLRSNFQLNQSYYFLTLFIPLHYLAIILTSSICQLGQFSELTTDNVYKSFHERHKEKEEEENKAVNGPLFFPPALKRKDSTNKTNETKKILRESSPTSQHINKHTFSRTKRDQYTLLLIR